MKLSARILFVGVVICTAACQLAAKKPGMATSPGREPANSDVEARQEWFKDAKFGMFIHWGAYSVASVEASWPIMTPHYFQWPISFEQYIALPAKFNPTQYDPKAWVKLAQDAGQKYIVFTTKHHDGFAMFDADNMSDYKITRTPYGKDTFAMLAEAAHDAGMKLGAYYSPPDMYHPGFRDTRVKPEKNWAGDPTRPEWGSYLDYMEAQLTQLLTRYGEISDIWFDGLDHQEKYQGQRFHDLIHRLQPNALINDRIGLPGDYDTPEQKIPGQGNPDRPWETCMTINDTWGYNKNDRNFKSADTLISNLIDVVSKGGNYLLNVGPSPEGVIQPEFQDRLRAIGAWLKVNGDSIYGTRMGPVQGVKEIRTTQKNGKVYVHIMSMPLGGMVQIGGLMGSFTHASVLASGQSLSLRNPSSGVWQVEFPAALRSAKFPVLVLE